MSTADESIQSEPTAAVRVRSVLARAVSLSLTTEGRAYDLIGMHSVSRRGRIALHPPTDSPLGAQVAHAPRGSLAALLEFTDIAPTAVRDRVRARVTVAGWLAPDGRGGGTSLRVDIAHVTLRTAAGSVEVGLDELTLAEPDPLAVEEAAMLTHLADAHEDMVAGLVALAGHRVPPGFTRVVPLALDRHGITLRCEYPGSRCDVRLLFPEPAEDATAAGERIRRFLAIPGTGARHRRSSSRP
ncbi:DUF2470 domain-containing protein [Streptomyces coeruleoprunus]|uniref:DUF2470 domain-containing protein n=1 Tax=Streptomyces coeruleoprunus TaxID=285563 RepID=A0ABV9XA18_9ACTN